MSKTEVDLAALMRQGMRRLASGIVVVTANNSEGQPFAMTASSITSISDTPPSLLVCVNQSARMNNAMAETHYFSVNLLAQSHQAVSDICADPTRIDQRFEQGNWMVDKTTGLHVLSDAVATFLCEKKNSIDHGTHSIYIGDIVSGFVSDSKRPALVYLDGAYHFL